MNTLTRVFLVGFTGALFLSDCVQYTYTPLPHAEVIGFADRAATKAGYHLADFEPVPVLALKGQRWSVLYQGKMPPASRDGLAELKMRNHLLVRVENNSGAGQVMPGE